MSDAPLLLLSAASEPQTFDIVTKLLGGLALFLFGMDQMSFSLRKVAGERMKTILSRLTTNRVMGVFTGAFVTAIIQSSSVTTVLVVGFISAGLMTLGQSIGVILGADIGTTITAQIIALKVTRYALLFVALGFAMAFIGRRNGFRNHGKGIMGLGLIFFGMVVMGEAMMPLRSSTLFLDWMTHMENPLMGILVGAVFTALIQASAATVGVIIVLASQGLVSLPAGIALLFGANIGTCITAVLAAIGRPREAMRAALVHVIFKVVGVLIWLAFIPELAWLVEAISPGAESLSGTDRLAEVAPRQIANAHTLFNVVNTLLFLPFSTQFARLVEWLLRDRPTQHMPLVRAKYLDLDLLSTPSLALDRARLEMLHLGNCVREMLERILPAVVGGTRDALQAISKMDDKVDDLHGKIVTYLGKASTVELNVKQTEELIRLLETVNDLENIGDVIETNLVSVGRSRIEKALVISSATRAVIEAFHSAITRGFDAALMAISQKNEEAAWRVIELKAEIDRLEDDAAIHRAQRLVAEAPNRLAAYTIETDILANLKRVYAFSERMARAAIR